jgi:hypothetical protein
MGVTRMNFPAIKLNGRRVHVDQDDPLSTFTTSMGGLAMCAKCKRPVSRIGALEDDWEKEIVFTLICHGERHQFKIPYADFATGEDLVLKETWFFGEETTADKKMLENK